MRRARSEPRVPRSKLNNKSQHVSFHTLQPLDLHALAGQLELSKHAADNLLTAVDRWPDTPLSSPPPLTSTTSSTLPLPPSQVASSNFPSHNVQRQPLNQHSNPTSSLTSPSENPHQQKQREQKHHQHHFCSQSTQSRLQSLPPSQDSAHSPSQLNTSSSSACVFPTAASGPPPSTSALRSPPRPPRAFTSPIVAHRSPSSTNPLKLWSSLRRLWDVFVPTGPSGMRDPLQQLPAPSPPPPSPPSLSTNTCQPSNNPPAVTVPQNYALPTDIDSVPHGHPALNKPCNTTISDQSHRHTDDICPSPVTPAPSVQPSAAGSKILLPAAAPPSPSSRISVVASGSTLSDEGCSEESVHPAGVSEPVGRVEVQAKADRDVNAVTRGEEISDDCLDACLGTSSDSDDSTELSMEGSTVYADVKEDLSKSIDPVQETISSCDQSSDCARKSLPFPPLSSSLLPSPLLPSSYLPPSRQASSPLSTLPPRRSGLAVPAPNEKSSPSTLPGSTGPAPLPPPDRSCAPLVKAQQQSLLHVPPTQESGTASNRLFVGRTHTRAVSDMFEHDLSEADLSPAARPSDDDLSYLRSISSPPLFFERGRRNSAPALSNNKTLSLRRRFSLIPPSPVLPPPSPSSKSPLVQPSPLFPSPLNQTPVPADLPELSGLSAKLTAGDTAVSTAPPASVPQNGPKFLSQQTQQLHSNSTKYQQTQPTQLSWDVPPPAIPQCSIPRCDDNQTIRINPPQLQAPKYYQSVRGQQPQSAASSHPFQTLQPAIQGQTFTSPHPHFSGGSQMHSQGHTSTAGGLHWQSPVQYNSQAQQYSNESLRRVHPPAACNSSTPQPVELRLPSHLHASHQYSTKYQPSHSSASNDLDRSMAHLTQHPQTTPRRSLSLRPNTFSNRGQVSYPNASPYTVSPPPQDSSFRRRASLRTPPPRASTISAGLDRSLHRRTSIDPTLDHRIAQLRSLQQQLRSQRRMTEVGNDLTNGSDYRGQMLDTTSDRRSHINSEYPVTIPAAQVGHVPRNVRLPMNSSNVSTSHRPMRDGMLSVESSLYA